MRLLDIQIIDPLRLEPVDQTLWAMSSRFSVDFKTNEGIYHSEMDIGWLTDLRSGSDLINPMVPKWGNPKYTAAILFHDLCFSGHVSFELSNDLLMQGMVLSGQVSKTKASAARWVLNAFGRSHYYELDTPLGPPYQDNRSKEHFELKDYRK